MLGSSMPSSAEIDKSARLINVSGSVRADVLQAFTVWDEFHFDRVAVSKRCTTVNVEQAEDANTT